MGAGAVSDACRRALADGCRPGVDYEGEYRVDWTNSLDEGLENPVIHAVFSFAAQLVVLDRETGKIDKVVAVHDVGRAVNPLLCEGQIQGAVHMGLGYALSEEFPCDDEGRPQNMTLRSLGIMRAKDVPTIEVDSRRGAAAEIPLRDKGCRRDRVGAHGRSGRECVARPRRPLALGTADARPGRRGCRRRGTNERSHA